MLSPHSDPWPLSTLLLSYRKERCEIHNTLNIAPRLSHMGLMAIPSCSSEDGRLDEHAHFNITKK